ncbi:MAG: NAD(P)/FAD-dependent oxidoreductase [Bacteroidota bacterium]
MRKEQSLSFDLIVIGAGSGGLVAALTGNRRGLKTAMIEKHKIGGECTHTGCVPSKALIQSAKQWVAAQNLHKFGFRAPNLPKPDFAQLMEHVHTVIEDIYDTERPEVFQKAGIETIVHPSGAKFLDPHTLQVGDQVLTAQHFVIATGSSPLLPDVPGRHIHPGLHNENFWDIREQPKRLLFVGGGIISAELGQSMSRLGSQVTILGRNPRMLKVLDDDTAAFITEVFKAEGMDIISGSEVTRLEKYPNHLKVFYQTEGKEHYAEVDEIFWATGRTPNIQGLDLEKAGIAYNERGIQTNDYLQTTQPHIYACGDVTTLEKFTHTAAYQAEICLDNIMFEEKRINDLQVLPWTIFTGPEIGHVGLSEKAARAKYGEGLSIFKVHANIDRYRTDLKVGGFLKVMFDTQDKVVGAEAIGEQAGEWIQQITLIMKHDIPIQSLAQTIYAYPTYTEIVKKVFSRYYRTKGY